MRLIKLTLLLSFIAFIDLYAQSSIDSQMSYGTIETSNTHVPIFTDTELENRVKQMVSSVVAPRFTSTVKSYINTYTIKKREKTAAMIGRIAMYFPMFEQYAREHHVPTDLKYLSIVESALNPNAESRSGAVGLWQFMPGTGKEYGLVINREIDERKDPHKSTKAAFRYLKKQYDRYGSWELALAAYNGGPGRVNRAIKRGHSKNFWRISKYLPRETRNYIPAFIGATYIAHYFQQHDIVPIPVGPELEHTALSSVFEKYTFQEISEITGTPYFIVALLNPSYKRAYIPLDRSGNNLILPQADMIRFLKHIGRPDHRLEQMIASRVPAPNMVNQEDVVLLSHEVNPGESLEEIAYLYNCTADNLIQWNKLGTTQLSPGQHIMLFVQKKPTEQLKYQQIENLKPLGKRSLEKMEYRYNVPATPIPQIMDPGKFANARPGNQGDFEFYRIKRRETLMDVVAKHPNVTLEEIMILNDLDRFSKIKPGKKLKVRKK